MKLVKICLLIAVPLLACSCVPLPSFHPLWDAQHDGFDPQLAGTWRDDDSDDEGLTIVSDPVEKSYALTFREKDLKTGKQKQSRLNARMVRLGTHRFLDIEASESSVDDALKGEVYQPVVLMHVFARVELDGDSLKLAMLDDEIFAKRAATDHLDIAIQKQGDTILLTAETVRIQQVIGNLAEDKELWGDLTTLRRAPHP
jgi:hypothetical protein